MSNKLIIFLQDLSKVDKQYNSRGAIRINNIDSLITMLNDYGYIVQNLSTGIVDNRSLKTVVDTLKAIHELRYVEFENESIPELLLEVYQNSLSILSSLNQKFVEEIESDLTKESLENPSNLQDYYNASLDKNLRASVKKYQDDELAQVDKLSKDDVSMLLLGLPLEAIQRTYTDSESRLCNNLQSIYDEAKCNNQTQNLSNEPFDVKKHKARVKQSLDSTLDAVADSVIRNHPRERYLSQKPKRSIATC